jgi:enoyl-[acyl-carrier protein] reductase I
VGGADAFETLAAQKAPLRRGVEGREVGDTAVYLASGLSSGVSGETIYVDCGINTMGV